MNTSILSLVSAATRSCALDSNATTEPLADKVGEAASPASPATNGALTHVRAVTASPEMANR
jgi:hypothetical protein